MTPSQTTPRDTGRNAEPIVDVSRYLARYEVTIRVVSGTRKGAEYPLRRQRLTVGRDKQADLVFDDDLMSRVHAAVEFREGAFHLQDLASRNGVRLNGERVTSSPLKDGDRFEVGNHSFGFSSKDRHPPSITRSGPAEA